MIELKQLSASVLPFVSLWLWQVFLAPDLSVFAYTVLVALFCVNSLVQFADGFERGMK
jgi:hypothetical protein